MKLIKSNSIEVSVKKNGEEDMRGIFQGSFIKSNGDLRRMEFCFSKNKIEEVIKKGELVKVREIIGGKKGSFQVQVRYFNFGKMVGDIFQCN